jgi:hypothetical protein
VHILTRTIGKGNFKKNIFVSYVDKKYLII